MNFSLRSFAYLGVLFNALIWGLSWWPFRHMDAAGLHPLWATAAMYLVTALGIVLIWRKALFGPQGAWRNKPWLWVLVLSSGINNAAFNWGVTIGDVVRVVLLFYLMPMWAVLFARWILKEPITRWNIVQILMALCGASLVMQQAGTWGFPVPSGLGDWLGLLGGLTFAMTITMLKKNEQEAPWLTALAMFGGAGGVSLVLGLGLAAVGFVPWVGLPGFTSWLPVALIFGVLMVCANLTMQYGAARLKPSVTSLILLNEILFATASAVWWGDAQMTFQKALGFALIVGAALVAILQPRRA
jgi:drug/metabolite transporter (DMT)-like permease